MTGFDSPFVAAGHGFIDGGIGPRQTRPKLIALRMLENKVATTPEKSKKIFLCYRVVATRLTSDTSYG